MRELAIGLGAMLAFAKFFDNGYDRVTLAPAMPDTGGAS